MWVHSASLPPLNLPFPNPKRQRQAPLNFSHNGIQGSFDDHVAKWMTTHTVAKLMLESDDFRLMLDLYKHGNYSLPSRKTITSIIAQRAKNIKAQVVQRLSKAPSVSVGLDGWTNARQDKVINIVPVAQGVAYYWQSLVMSGRSTAIDQQPLVASALSSLIDHGVLVLAIVTDNESVNYTLFGLLSNTFPFLIHVPCAAHTVQLCVKKILCLAVMKTVVFALHGLLSAYERSKEIRLFMKQLQRELRQGKAVLQLLKPCDTRWSSMLISATRLLLLRDCIEPTIPKVLANLAARESRTYHEVTFTADSFWKPLEQIVAFLKPFQIATDVVQSDEACLMDVYEQFVQLAEHVGKLPPDSVLSAAKQPALAIIVKEWDTHVNEEAVIASAILSFHPHVSSTSRSSLARAQQWCFAAGAKFLAHYRLSVDVDEQRISRVLAQQFSALISKSGVFADIDEHKQSMQRQQLSAADRSSEHSTWDARPVWGLYRLTATELALWAQALLSVTASEAAVERSFSAQGIVHSDSRNRLQDESVQDEMMCKFNRRPLENTHKIQRGTWVELDDDYQPAGDPYLC